MKTRKTERPHAHKPSMGHPATAETKAEGEGALGRHRARCQICRHPEREEIEREFIDWTSPREIAATWKMASYRAVYRHAHATGLIELRRKNWQGALERIIERVSEVQVTASAVIAAVRLSERLERERGEAAERGGAQQRFVLSLDGLPRTDAVTGHEGRTAEDSYRLAHRRAARAGLKPAPTNGGKRKKKRKGGERTQSGGDRGTLSAAADATVVRGRPDGSPPPATEQERRVLRGNDEAEEQGHRLKPVPPEGGRRDVAPTNGGGGGAERGGGTDKSVAPDLRAIDEGADPRVALGEDGRVAGMAWPWKERKIAFAPRRRWRRS